LGREFSRAAWIVIKKNPIKHELDSIEKCESFTAVIADWQLKGRPFSGLEVLFAIRKRNSSAACVLYTIQAMEEEWRLVSDDARKSDILALVPGKVTPDLLYRKVLEEVQRLKPGFLEPRQPWKDYEAWIRPEPDPPDPRLDQAINSVGRRHLVPIIKDLFRERGPHRPIRYTFLQSGFSGARVFLLKDPTGTISPNPRYILKVAKGDDGFSTLRDEHARFHKHILGDGPHHQKLVGYVAEELRPARESNEPARANDWFGIAYREVGNGAGRITSFRELYLDVPESGQESFHYRQLFRFLDHLYNACLGNGYHRGAIAVSRKLWAAAPEADAFYCLESKKKIEIFTALDELRPRARTLLDRLCSPNATNGFISKITEFMDEGRCSDRKADPTLFYQTFQLLTAGTHRDLHAGNILAVEVQGETEPFVIDFSEFQERGHPFYDYARLESEIRLRLMNYEDGSDILDELLGNWLHREERLNTVVEKLPGDEPILSPGSVGFIDKGYWVMTVIRGLAYQNLSLRLKDQSIRPSKENFSAQYTAALLHRTLVSLASTDIVEEKKILGVWLAANLISRLGTLVSRMT
jgi:hypothetical protein